MLNEMKNNNILINRMKSLNILYEKSNNQIKKNNKIRLQKKFQNNHTIKEEEESSQNNTMSDRFNLNKKKEPKIKSNEFYEILIEKNEEQKEENFDISRNQKNLDDFNSKNLFKSNSEIYQENNYTYLSLLNVEDNMKKSFISENKNFELLFKSYENLSTNDSHMNIKSEYNLNNENRPITFNQIHLNNDQFSCNNCEIYYKNCIINNKPINIRQCSCCGNLINTKSLEFYLEKYKYLILNLNTINN